MISETPFIFRDRARLTKGPITRTDRNGINAHRQNQGQEDVKFIQRFSNKNGM